MWSSRLPAGLALLVSCCGGPTGIAADSAVPRVAEPQPAPPATSALDVEPLLEGGGFGEAASLFTRGSWGPARAALLAATASEPSSERGRAARLVAALCAARAGEPAAARRELEALSVEVPMLAPLALAHAAQAALEQGDARGATALAERVPSDGAYAAMARMTLADAAFAAGDFAVAARRYQELLEESGTGRRPYVRFRLGESLARQVPAGRRRPADVALAVEAVRALRMVSVTSPSSHWAHDAEERIVTLERGLGARDRMRLAVTPEQSLQRADALASAQKNREAEEAYRGVVRRLPARSPLRCEARLRMAESVMRQRDRGRAGPLFEEAALACREQPEQAAKALFFAGKMRSSAGEHDTARARFADVEQYHRESRYADDARLQGALSLLALGDPDAFREKLRALPVDYPAGDMRAEALWQVAWHAWQQADAQGVLQALDELTAIAPREEGWYAAGRAPYWRGRALARLGRTEEALASYEQALRDAPLSYYMLLALARIDQSDPARARRLWAELTADPAPRDGAPPEPPSTLTNDADFQRALFLLRAGLGELAARELRALGLDGPSASPEGLWLAAYLFDRAGDPARAHDILRRRLTTFERGYPTGANRRRWKVAYPRAFAGLVSSLATERQVPEAMVYAIVREESGFDPAVESWANAVGLTQLMPATARRFGAPLGLTVSSDTLRDPATNLRIGISFMSFLWQRFSASPVLVPAGYNAGESAVKRWVESAPGRELDELVESIPYDQTRGYTKRVTESYGRYMALYGDEMPLVPLQLTGGTDRGVSSPDAAPAPRARP